MKEEEKKRIARLIRKLKKHYPDAKCSLSYMNPFQLMVATILSAQCTDKRVNIVTPKLFKRFPEPVDLAEAPLSKIEEIIQSTGFYRQKAKSLKQTSNDLVEKFGGEVPDEISELTKLRGIGRKTANVVLGNAFDKPAGVVVDTHVKRISNRLGLSKEQDPVKIEKDLNSKIPKKHWVMFSHWLIWHGRSICQARSPKCEACFLLADCPRKGLKKLKSSIRTKASELRAIQKKRR